MSNFSFPYPFFPVQFTMQGTVFQPAEVDALMNGLQSGVTDLFILSHGWNNDMDNARTLYSGLMAQIAAQVAASPALAGRSYAILGILWPSKKFDDADLIPSGAASLEDAVTPDGLRARVKDLSDLMQAKGWPMESGDGAVEAKLNAVIQSIDDWSDDPGVRRDVVQSIRALLPAGSASADDASDRFFALTPDQLLTNLSRSLTPPPNTPDGANASSMDPFATGPVSGLGGAASFRDTLGGIQTSLWHYLNFTTYYTMKARAGDVGVNGVKPLIERIRTAHPSLRLHLIGHSFGCRVVTAAVNALAASDLVRPNTMTLLEGAFSHYAFAAKYDGTNDGAFRSVISGKKVRGPILITHTRNDKAVGVAYPIASRIAGQVASALGDENDLYGGLGSNGAQNDACAPERVAGTLLDVGGQYPFASGATCGRLYNLKSDAFIGGHSDIVKPQVGYAIAVAMATPDAR
jgi:hypothetical protein